MNNYSLYTSRTAKLIGSTYLSMHCSEKSLMEKLSEVFLNLSDVRSQTLVDSNTQIFFTHHSSVSLTRAVSVDRNTHLLGPVEPG
jgi:hypothetical protein